MEQQDLAFMKLAFEQAEAASAKGEVPVGAVLTTATGKLLASAHNKPVATHDPTAHAEIAVIRAAAAQIGNYRLPDTILYVTLEPCAMCAGAISMARIGRVVFAASDPKGGAVLHGGRFFEQATCHHKPDISYGLMAEEASQLLRDFFRARRSKN